MIIRSQLIFTRKRDHFTAKKTTMVTKDLCSLQLYITLNKINKYLLHSDSILFQIYSYHNLKLFRFLKRRKRIILETSNGAYHTLMVQLHHINY